MNRLRSKWMPMWKPLERFLYKGDALFHLQVKKLTMHSVTTWLMSERYLQLLMLSKIGTITCMKLRLRLDLTMKV